jgi:small-conductance mechanosensitive channel
MENPNYSSHLPIMLEGIFITLVLVLWLALVWRLRGRTLAGLSRLATRSVQGIASPRLRKLGMRRLSQLARVGTRLLSLALVLFGFFMWSGVLMELLPATHELVGHLETHVFTKMEELAFAAIGMVPNLIVVGVIYFFTRVTHELLNHYFRSISDGEVVSSLFDEITAETTRRLANIGVWVVAVIIAFPYLPGSGSAAFRGVSVLAGLMLSIGSANLVTQFTSGLALIYGRVIRPGDYIETSQGEGVVERIGLLACSIRTPRDELVSLPHSVVSAALKNFSRGSAGVRFTTEVTIGYDAPWRQVRELLLAAAADTPGIRAEPAPLVRQTGLEDFYVRYELQFTPENPAERRALLSRLHEGIQDRFHGAGVQIMSPHYMGDPVALKIPSASAPPVA